MCQAKLGVDHVCSFFLDLDLRGLSIMAHKIAYVCSKFLSAALAQPLSFWRALFDNVLLCPVSRVQSGSVRNGARVKTLLVDGQTRQLFGKLV